MKKALFFAGLAAASLAFVGCNKEADIKGLGGCPVEIVLSDAQTRTVNDGLSTNWVADDALAVFYAPAGETTYSVAEFTVTDPANNVATGEVALTADAYDWYLFYPYDSHLVTPANTSKGYMTVGGKNQTQVGNDSKAHLAGPSLPIVGVAKNVASDATPSVSMKHVSSVVAVNITNDTDAPLTVNSITFTAPEDIVGTYYINFADIDNVTFKSSGDSYVSKSVTLTVQDGTAIDARSSAKFYIAIKPFTAAAESELKLTVVADQGEVEKTAPLGQAYTFAPGTIKTLNLSYKAPTVIPTITIADIKAAVTSTAQASPSEFTGQIAGAVVSYVNGNNAFIQDDTGGILFYKAGHGLQAGDVLNGVVNGAGYIRYGVKQLTSLTGFEKTTGTAPAPVTLTLGELLANYDRYVSVRVKLANVTVTDALTKSDRNGAIKDDDDNALNLYAQVTNTLEVPLGVYDMVGYPTYYNDVKQLGLWAMDDIVVSEVPFLAAEADATEVPASATSVIITLTGNVEWTAEVTQGEAELDNTVGDGDDVITMTFDANTDTENAKQYTVLISTDDPTLVASGDDKITINITQAKAPKEGVTIFHETFDKIKGTGGRDGSFSGSIASSDFKDTDETWASFEKMYGAYECAKYGTGSAEGSMTTRAITLTGDAQMTFEAAGWASGTNTLTVTANGATLSGDTSITLTASTWKSYTVDITGATGSFTLTFTGKRGFIDDIKVTSEDAVPPTEATLVSIAVSGQTTTFNVGDTFTFDGTVTATYSDGSTKTVTPTNVTTPDMTTAGTKTVTVTYTEGDASAVFTYDITVNAATTITVSQACALADNAAANVADAIVAAICTKGFIATDGSKNVYVFQGKQPDVALGDKVNFTATKVTYYGIPELTTSTDDVLTVVSHGNEIPRTTLVDITSTIDTYTSSDTDYITVTGTLVKNGNYYNVTVPDATKYASPMYLYGIDPSALIGQTVILTGYFNTVHSKGYVQVIATAIEGADPDAKHCVVSPDVLNVAATATSAQLSIQANAAWTVTSDNSAFTVSPSNGNSDATVTISFAANETQTAKVANITVSCPDANVNQTIVLTQAAAVPQSDSYTIVFGNGVKSPSPIEASTKATTVISSGTDYVTTQPFTVNSGKAYYGDNQQSIRIGKSGEASKLTIALSDAGKIAAQSIVVNCQKMTGSKNADAQLTVNGVGPQSPAAADASQSDLTFTISSSNNLSEIVLEGTAAIVIYSITVNK